MLHLPIVTPADFRIIAHRGASVYAPENALSAFLLAERMGATEVELDVRFSRDRKLMICHDESLDRFGYPGMKVAECAAADLATLDMGSWFSPYLYRGERMMQLDTLFRIFGKRFTYHVEMKDDSPALPQVILEVISDRHLQARTIVTSKYFHLLEQIRKLNPDLSVGWLVSQLTEENVEQAAKSGFFQICPRTDGVDRDRVSAAHKMISEVRAHHVRSIDDVVRAMKAGCDGVTINWPDWLSRAEPADGSR